MNVLPCAGGYAAGAVASPIFIGASLAALRGTTLSRLGPSYWAVSGLAVLTAVAVGGLQAPQDPQAVAVAAAQALSDGKLRPTKTLSDVLTLDPVSPKLSTVTSRGSFVQLLGDPASPVSPTAVVGLPLDSDPEAGPGGAPGAETTTPGVRHQHGLQVVLVGASSSSCQGPTSITTGGAATARRLTGSIVGRGCSPV
jgi:hypothetical protein